MGWSTSPNSLHLAVCSFGGQGGLLAYDDVMRTHRLKGEAASSRELSGLARLTAVEWYDLDLEHPSILSSAGVRQRLQRVGPGIRWSYVVPEYIPQMDWYAIE